MDKSVLVIDTPDRCFNCPLHQIIDAEENEHEFMMFCNAEYWREPITHQPIENLEERPSWCPLRPLPSQMKYNDDLWTNNAEEEYYKEGWNRFYEMITGETE